MARKPWIVVAGLAIVSVAAGPAAHAQERRSSRIDVEKYVIDADVNPRTQTLTANVQVQFVPRDDTSSATFELNNVLNVSKVVDGQGRQVSASRSQQDFTVRLSFPERLPKGQPSTVTFTYDGRLAGDEESPVYGIKFAAIKPDITYLMYPARWFPVNDYTADRFMADLRVTVPTGFQVIASGNGSTDKAAGDKTTYRFQFTQPSFPGSIAVVQGQPQRVSSNGVSTEFYVRNAKSMVKPYGEEIGRVMTYLTSIFGLPPQATLTVVETEAGTPNGYSAPGILFISPKGFGANVNTRMLVNQISRQWWGALVSPATRNHLWIQNGMARYAEMLYEEHTNGSASIQPEIRDTYVEALTVDEVPLIQAARLEDYSPEFWASTAAKGAAVLHMLRSIMGDQKFEQLVKTVPDKFAWKSITTDDFRKVAEQISGENLQYFFLQWIESNGAPEFKLEYTVFRTEKGFRVMGKVSQDLDTFRMPVDLKIETEGNPETKRVEVVGTSSEFIVDTFGKPKRVTVDAGENVLHYNNEIRVAVAIKKGEQFAEIGEYTEALKQYQKALDVNRSSSLAHYRVAEVFMLQNNYQASANEFRAALDGDLDPKWTEVWAHINLGKIFDITGQRERAVNEYQLAARTKDNSQNAQEEAAKYLKQPYERQSLSSSR